MLVLLLLRREKSNVGGRNTECWFSGITEFVG